MLGWRHRIDREQVAVKSMKQFGNPIVCYEGVAVVVFEGGDKKTESRGYYEAAQFPSGRIVISVMPTDVARPTEVSLLADPDSTISLHGSDVDGWTIKTSGQSIFSRLNWQLAPMSRQPAELSFSTQYLEASRNGASDGGYNRAQFMVSNLVWHDRSGGEPAPIRMRVMDYEVIVAPIDGYLEITQRLVRTHGVEPTALVSIETQPGHQMPLQGFRDFMDDLVYVFRLLTGNLVDWFYGEAVDDQTERPVERIHKYAVTGPYSNTIRFRPLKSGYQALIPKVDVAELTAAFFNDSELGLGKAALKPLINQLTNACDETLYLESRGLLASTLIELIAAKYAYANGASEVIPHSDFETNIFPTVETAIESTALERHIKDQIKNHLRGAYRSSLRRKLRLLNDGKKMGLGNDDISRIVDVRDALVHEGTYRSSFDNRGWAEDYQLLIWASFVALCRLAGYSGQVPRLQEGLGLKV